ncbi:hypothetical protein DM860_004167 [Cuscuta australis]|uniref:Uncharacterized protein n=1 Tax=Cuscuta australis TaxID=267555 RepID=A0A328CVG7_9ASTE|nr:hypothetical protein DM860_004167 [Cuscuta australis]
MIVGHGGDEGIGGCGDGSNEDWRRAGGDEVMAEMVGLAAVVGLVVVLGMATMGWRGYRLSRNSECGGPAG